MMKKTGSLDMKKKMNYFGKPFITLKRHRGVFKIFTAIIFGEFRLMSTTITETAPAVVENMSTNIPSGNGDALPLGLITFGLTVGLGVGLIWGGYKFVQWWRRPVMNAENNSVEAIETPAIHGENDPMEAEAIENVVPQNHPIENLLPVENIEPLIPVEPEPSMVPENPMINPPVNPVENIPLMENINPENMMNENPHNPIDTLIPVANFIMEVLSAPEEEDTIPVENNPLGENPPGNTIIPVENIDLLVNHPPVPFISGISLITLGVACLAFSLLRIYRQRFNS